MYNNLIKELCSDREAMEKHLREKLSGRITRSFEYKKTSSTEAAVLIPLFYKDGAAHLLFTKRTVLVEHHKGQISFPGGKRDATDESLVFTALRETEEEIGIQSKDIKIIGQTDRFLTNTGYMVTPFVGMIPFPHMLHPNEVEIEKIITIPLLYFFKDNIFEIKPYEIDGEKWMVHYYYYQSEMIWGVTGFLLSNFLSIVFDLERNISEYMKTNADN
ncbi:MAG: CoA pyrophosphatase [Calditrichaceae bacterium]|nr:CoA pyrophosphatase [Calditrichaceae bacterium]MBN2707432.1 CoA pyrophosphatase [Calditrichaceae bacterium]RQV94000.1 MAG: CoA pyrophosphatase [Calditrichota bacterium]